MRLPRLVVGLVLAGAALTAPAAAAPYKVQVMAVTGDGSARYSPCGVGGSYTFPLLAGATVGQVWTVDVDMSTNPWTITNPVLTSDPPCFGAGQTSGPPGPPLPGFTLGPSGGSGQTSGPGAGDLSDGLDETGDAAADLPKAAFNRVFTFRCAADGYAGGEIAVTINAIKGLGRAIRDEFEEVVDDQDGLVLVGRFARIYRGAKRVGRGALDDADSVAVKGKLLRPAQWHEDEDGNAVPTIRAKRVTITG